MRLPCRNCSLKGRTKDSVRSHVLSCSHFCKMGYKETKGRHHQHHKQKLHHQREGWKGLLKRMLLRKRTRRSIKGMPGNSKIFLLVGI